MLGVFLIGVPVASMSGGDHEAEIALLKGAAVRRKLRNPWKTNAEGREQEMRLEKFRVHEFRSVWDSGDIEVGDVTCLVGKNEAGKTALLKALYRVAPIVNEDAAFDATDDYPRKEYGDYLHEVESGKREPAEVIAAEYRLELDDIAAVEQVFGSRALKSQTICLTKGYANERTYNISFDEGAARAHVIAAAELTDATRATLEMAASWGDLKTKLEGVEATVEVTRLLAFVNVIFPDDGSHYTFNKILSSRIPALLYFDEYYQMLGHENVQTLIQRKAAGTLKPSDHPLLGLINLARLNLEDLLGAQRTTELVNKLEGAGNHLTRQILRYWSQNKHLQMRFDIREARSEDPEHMRSGQNIWGRVYDQVHWATTELGSRSKGFVWFFSFLAWYEDVKRSNKKLILLLDEPGLSLHGRAQADLLRYIEQELKPNHQVIYTTHSPFMVDPANFNRVRIVQDRGIDADDPLPKEEDGTKVLTDLFDASDDSLFPLQGALGYDIHQTLFVGPNCLVVEGPADMLYLQAMSSVLERDGRTGLDPRWTITPVGGSGKVSTFVSLLGNQKGMKLAVLVDVAVSDSEAVEALYKKRLLQRKNVHTYSDFVGSKEADIEDMFDRGFYVDLVNAEYAKQLNGNIGHSNLNAKLPRTVKAIEKYLERYPLNYGEFGHFRPARYFTEHLETLTTSVSDNTKTRFETAFKKINSLL
ncbi:ATP-binding protein [Mesorhizobium sp. M1334]|uniref:AAA family ATPase n=1 Tax=Mesorhizobium sp. M1334 TaxID=2957084 RepID=UPI00333C16C6